MATRIRYTGSNEAVVLAVPGAGLPFERGQWADPFALAAAAGVPAYHLDIVLAGLGPDWEHEKPKTRKPKPKPTAPEPPAEPDSSSDEEQS